MVIENIKNIPNILTSKNSQVHAALHNMLMNLLQWKIC